MDHILHITNIINGEYEYHIVCNISFTKYEIIKKALNSQYPYIFEVVDFNIALIPFLEVLNFLMTVCYNFVDVFIISLSIGITMRFDQINDRLVSVGRKEMSDAFWIEIRNDFVGITQLLELVDNEFATLIVLSCFTNLFFICLQMFWSFKYYDKIVRFIFINLFKFQRNAFSNKQNLFLVFLDLPHSSITFCFLFRC